MDRSKRTGEPLVLAFVDVVGLKAINDSRGHQEGDRVLREVARRRYAEIAVRLAVRSDDALMTVGLAAYESGDSTDELIDRADRAMIRERRQTSCPAEPVARTPARLGSAWPDRKLRRGAERKCAEPR
jgi:PleD family two-component response regulator